jgi:hypothetical protein
MEGLADLLPVVIEIAVPIVVVLISWVVRRLVKKYKLQEYINQEELIEKLVLTAVNYAEKYSQSLNKYYNKPLDGVNKMKEAISYIEKEIEKLGLTKITKKSLTARIEAALFSYNI